MRMQRLWMNSYRIFPNTYELNYIPNMLMCSTLSQNCLWDNKNLLTHFHMFLCTPMLFLEGHTQLSTDQAHNGLCSQHWRRRQILCTSTIQACPRTYTCRLWVAQKLCLEHLPHADHWYDYKPQQDYSKEQVTVSTINRGIYHFTNFMTKTNQPTTKPSTAACKLYEYWWEKLVRSRVIGSDLWSWWVCVGGV